jgi:hypothetical protein
MESDRPGMLIRKHLMQLLAKHGESEVWALSGSGGATMVN